MSFIRRRLFMPRRHRKPSLKLSRWTRGRNGFRTCFERLESRHLLATFLVNSTADAVDPSPGDGACDDGSGACTLRGAIIEANALPGPDIITLPAGTYALTIPGTAEDAALRGDLDITDNLTITGAGAADTVVDAGGLDRVFHIPAPNPVSSVTLDGLTIKGGLATDVGSLSSFISAASGGGILNDIFGNSITLSGSIVTGNTALGSPAAPFYSGDAHGGGIADVGGNWTVSSSQIVGNHALAVASPFGPGTGRGGGVYADFTTTTLLIDTSVSNNEAVGSPDDGFVGAGAGQGGGIFGNGGTWSMAGSTTIDRNQARGGLGLGMFSQGGAGEGGGIYSQGSFWNFSLSPGSVVSRNSAIGGNGGFFGGAAAGGGIYSAYDFWFDLSTGGPIVNNTISNNTAIGGDADLGFGIGGAASGGGIYTTGTITGEHLTIADNDASGGSGSFAGAGEGGGIFNAALGVTLTSTIVADNTASYSNPDVAGTFTSGGYNLIGDVGTAVGFGLPDQVGGGVNPVIDPLLGSLQNNGGPTETRELLTGSPATDAADPSSSVSTDQRGVDRPGINDVGAYEASVPMAGPAIAIETMTNGVDADDPTGPLIGVGGTANFTYVVTNPGGVALSNVVVTDSQAVAVTFVGGDANSNTLLDPGETWTYSGSKTVTAGQYMNTGTVTGDDPSLMQVTDVDDSHHFGVRLGIDIEKATNGIDADTPTGPGILVGETAEFTYTVTNTGNVALENVAVSDSEGVVVTYQSGDADLDHELDVSETWIYTGSTIVTPGQYMNTGTAVGDDATDTIPGQVTDSDDSHHFGLSGPDFVVTNEANLPHVSSAGDVITYTITVTNTGGVALTNPSITNPLLGGALTVPDADIGTQGAIDVGETWVFTRTYTVAQAVFDGAGVDANGAIDGDGDIDNTVTVDFDETGPQQASAAVLLSVFCNGSGFYRLQNHPFTPGVGLSLTGFAQFGAAARFNFDHALADVTMNVNDATISIHGTVYGGDPNAPARWQFELSYDVDGQTMDDDLFADVGSGTLRNLETNEVIQLTGKVGADSFAFELGNGIHDGGLLGYDGITGWGWVMYNGRSYVPGSDGAFAAELLECSTVLDGPDASFSTLGFQTQNVSLYGQGLAPTSGTSDTATWTFEDLTAGATYRVSATWSPDGAAATDAPFTVAGIVGGDVTVEIDQTAAPNDFDEHGVAWEDLAEVRAAGTSLTVQLSGLAGGDVSADAIRIERVQLVPDIEVRDEAGNLINRTIDFGTVLEGEVAPQTITVTNVGTATLDLDEVVLLSDTSASLDVTGFAPSLGPGESTTFKVVLGTRATGQYGATVMSLPFAFDARWTVIDTLIIDNRDSSPAFVQSGFTNYGIATFDQPQGYRGNIHYLQGTRPPDKATWTFSGLPDGYYRVAASWPAHPNRATDSPFKLYVGTDDGTPDAEQRLNQRIEPNDFNADNAAWERLGGLQVTGGTLTVTLDNAIADTSKYVIADAIRIQRADLSEPEIEVLDENSNSINGGIVLSNDWVGGTVAETVTILNLGPGQLDLGTITIAGDGQFSLDTTGTALTLPAGQSTTFDVLLDTSVAATYTATVSIPSLAPQADLDENPFVFTVAGTVVPLPPVGYSLIVDNRDSSPAFVQNGFTNYGIATFDQPQGYRGNIHYLQGARPPGKATWTFTGLPSGYYRVAASWPAQSNRATDSPFKLYNGTDDGTPDAERRLNQQWAPNDFSADNAAWERLGAVQVTGGTLTVTLDNNVANSSKYVIADAVRIELADPVPQIEVRDAINNIVETSVNLGTTLEGGVARQTITIRNTGPAQLDLDLSALSVSGAGFSLDKTGTAATVAGNSSTTFDVVLDTATAGSYSGQVTILSNDPDESSIAFNVTGAINDTLIIDDRDPATVFSAPGFTNYGLATFDQPQGYLGNIHYLRGNAPAGTATWTFTGLPDGFYQASATWFVDPNRATDSPFKVYVGQPDSTPDAAANLDQQQAPNDFTAAGVGWEDIGSGVHVTGGTLTVTLSNAISDTLKYVIADAIRIERLSALVAERGAGGSPASATLLTAAGAQQAGRLLYESADIGGLIDQAVAYWSAADPSAAARLAGVTVQVANLPGAVLGLASESTGRIWIDSNAAGYGWAVSRESRDKSQESESTISDTLTPSPHHLVARSSFDLLTVVTHELGHVLGLPDLDPSEHPHDVMAGRLTAGERRIPALTLDIRSTVPWADPVSVDRLFERWGTYEASQPADSIDWDQFDSPRPAIEPASLSANLALRDDDDDLLDRDRDDDDDLLDRDRDDRADGTAADAAIEQLLTSAGVRLR